MSKSYDELLDSMTGLAASLSALHLQATRELAPVVQSLIATHSRDVSRIEHTLDRLLDCACHSDGLVLFKSLCRHYYSLAPQAAAEYVMIYRNTWEEKEVQP
jgi:hypothetical protein